MSSNLDNHKSSVRDIAKLFAEEKRLGTKAADLVNGTALTKCLEINEAFEVLGTPAEQRVAMLASTVFCADTPHGTVVKQAISTFIMCTNLTPVLSVVRICHTYFAAFPPLERQSRLDHRGDIPE